MCVSNEVTLQTDIACVSNAGAPRACTVNCNALSVDDYDFGCMTCVKVTSGTRVHYTNSYDSDPVRQKLFDLSIDQRRLTQRAMKELYKAD